MFNTLRYAKKLESVGVAREQTEAHVQIIAEIVEDDLATKQDIKDLEYRLIIKLSAINGGLLACAIAILSTLLRAK